MKKITITTFLYILPVAVLMLVGSCKKITEERPENAFTEEDAIKTPQDVKNLLNSCYDAFANQTNGKLQTANDLLSDDLAKPLKDDGTFQTEIYLRNTTIFNSDVGDLYKNLYIIPFRINSMADLYDRVGVSAADRVQWDAEGKFLRAACHFETLKLWAQPSGFSPDNSHLGIVTRSENSQLPKPRSTVAETYAFIISDLTTAIANLPIANGNYANKDAAKALLAKVYYQMNRPDLALPLLNEVISAKGDAISPSLNRFDNAAAQSEYIFATISSNASTDNRGSRFIEKYRSDKSNESFTISKDLYTLLTTDTLDKRGKTLVGIVNAGKENEYYVTKKFNKDYFGVPYLTVTDMLLTRAEILAEQGDLPQAIIDVNKIIARAYSDSTTRFVSNAAPQSVVLTAVQLQRRLELHCEGDRVQSLKRRGAYFNSGQTIRNAPWNCPGMILQFPSVETGEGFIFNGTGGCN